MRTYEQIHKKKKYIGYIELIVALLTVILLVAAPEIGIVALGLSILFYIGAWYFKQI